MSTPKILSIVRDPSTYDDNDTAFQDIDYIRGLPIRLAPEIEKDRGVIVRKTYYSQATINPLTGFELFNDPIVEELYDYTRDPDGFALYRSCAITWFNEDGTKNPAAKVRLKTYSPVERVKESARRRTNVIDDLKIALIGMIAQTEELSVQDAISLAQSLFVTQQLNINTYVEAGTDFLRDYVTTSVEYPWMDNPINEQGVTIRMYILSQL